MWLAGGLFCLDGGFNFVAVVFLNFQVASNGWSKGYLKSPKLHLPSLKVVRPEAQQLQRGKIQHHAETD